MPLIKGRVVEDLGGHGHSGLRVVATFRHGADRVVDHSTVETDAAGDFVVQFGDAVFANLPVGVSVTVGFDVYDGDRRLVSVGSIDVLDRSDTEVLVVVAPPEGERVVTGTVRFEDGRPAARAAVVAYDRDMSRRETLGSTRTDKVGSYRIAYEPSQFVRHEKDSADVVVEVVAENQAVLASSEVQFNAPALAVVDLVIRPAVVSTSAGLSEYERYRAELAPVIEPTPLAELTVENVRFCASELGIPAERIQMLVNDARWQRFDPPPAVLYGVQRAGLPSQLDELLSTKRSELSDALDRAIHDGFIPPLIDAAPDDPDHFARVAARRDEVLDQLEEMSIDVALDREGYGRDDISALVDATQLDPDARRRFARAALRSGKRSDFWSHVGHDADLGSDVLAELRFGAAALQFADGHEPTMRHLLRWREDAQMHELRDLARLDDEAWSDVLADLDDLPEGHDTIAGYAVSLSERVGRSFPGPYVTHRLLADDEFGSGEFARFIESNPDFDLFDTNLRAFLGDGAIIDGIVDVGELTGEIETYQRLGRLLSEPGDFGTFRKLVSSGTTSGTRLAIMGEPEARTTLEDAGIDDPTIIDEVLEGARSAYAASEIIALGARDLVDSPEIFRTGPTNDLIDRLTRDAAPTWANLFGAAGGCECQHCRSMFGPAAYLTDLLQFLDRGPRSDGGSPLDVLVERRPDIPHIFLNCANTHVVVPHIDLVIEILADAVLATGPDGREQAPEPIDVPPAGAPPGEVDAYRDRVAQYQTLNPDGLDHDRLGAELRASPQRDYPAAFGRLGDAAHPWVLPIDRNHDRVRDLAIHLGADRWKLFELLGRSRVDVARAHLGIDARSWELLTRTITGIGDLVDTWGPDPASFATGPALEFLTWTGLSYDELSGIVRLSGLGLDAVTIDTSADPCDVRAHLVNVDPIVTGLDSLYRFTRLARLTGLAHTELHAVLMWFDASTIDEGTLVDLSTALRLAEQLQLAPSELARLERADLPAALGIAGSQFELLVDLTNHDPFPGSELSLAGLVDLVEFLGRLVQSGIEPDVFAYLVDDRDTSPPRFFTRPEQLSGLLGDLERNLAGEPPIPEADPTRDPALRAASIERRLDVIDSTLSEHLRIPQNVMEAVRSIADDADVGPLDNLLAFLGELDRSASRDDAERVLIWLRKIAVLVTALELDAHDVRRLPIETDGRTLDIVGVVDPTPLGTSDDLSARIARFEHLVDVVTLRRQMPDAEHDLLDLITADHTDLTTFLDVLAEQTGWDRTTLGQFADPTGLAFHDRFGELSTYRLLVELFARLERWPQSDPDPVGTLLTLGDPATPSGPLGERLLEIAKAHAGDVWPEALAPLADRWRGRDRDALLAWLIDRRRIDTADGLVPQFHSADEVYAYDLIDPQMSSCQPTSRIKQAAASVQLFIHRILLQLEDDVAADDPYWHEWNWRKNYRVWEAALKVFVYTENFLEPQLRDLKTQQFGEFTTALLQSELTEESATDAYLAYVDELTALAGLEYQAILEEATDGGTALHLVARTPDEPHTYYYRRRRPTTEWEPWERIPLRIEGNHILPLIWNGRLSLMWLVCRRAEEGRREDHDLKRYWDVFLHWASRRDGAWSAVHGSDASPLLRIRYRSLDPIVHRHGPERLRLAVDQHRPLELVVMFQSDWFGDPAFAEIEVARISESANGRSFRLVSDSRSRRIDGSNLVGRRDFHSFEPVGPALTVERLRAGVAVPRYDAPVSSSSDGVVDWNLTMADEELIADAGQIARAKVRTDLLREAPPDVAVVAPRSRLGEMTPLVAHLGRNTYLVRSGPREHPIVGKVFGGESTEVAYSFERLDHPYSADMSRVLVREGVHGLLDPPLRSPLHRQQGSVPGVESFEPFGPTDAVENWPLTNFDFSFGGAQSLENWEVFYHAVLTIADLLDGDGQFEDAHRWYRRIFDTADRSTERGPWRYFKTKPLHEALRTSPQTIEELLEGVAAHGDELRMQIDAWRADPFNPHALARLRHLAYAKSACFKYLDHLIAWADDLFALDTIESINEAAQLYLEASRILGDRPTFVERAEGSPMTYALVKESLGELSNFLEDIETGLPAPARRSGGVSTAGRPAPGLQLHFCVPSNPRLLGYWDTVADRLFKVRHCLDLQGSARQLALFAPPIDPALLVRARAAGLNLRDVLSRTRTASTRPIYRYAALYGRAVEVCETVRGFGSQLLSSLEKRDAEALGALRAGQDRMIADMLIDMRQQQIDEARRAVESLDVAKRQSQERHKFYSSRDRTIHAEDEQARSMRLAGRQLRVAQDLRLQQSIVSVIPETAIGFAARVDYGGMHLASSLGGIAGQLEADAARHDRSASLAGITASTERRWEDWQHQAAQAALEVEQIEHQRLAAKIRQAIAEAELDLQRKHLDHASETETYLLDKFSSSELFGWTTSQLMASHYQAYRLALDAALLAQTGASFELGLEPGAIDVIRLDHWNSGRKGLLAAELLRNDLNRLDDLFRLRNQRRSELTKHISLRMLDDGAPFARLLATGECTFELTQALFDADHENHTNRIIRSVAVTIPAVTGPYTNINGTLTLNQHQIRRVDSTASPAPPMPPQRIALSHGRADRGRFQTAGKDERHEPFELFGAESSWTLRVPPERNQFDLATINDVVITVEYSGAVV